VPPVKAIKSYLYKRPAVPPQEIVVVEPVVEVPEKMTDKEITPKPENKPDIVQATEVPIKDNTKEKPIEPEINIPTPKTDNKLLNKQKTKPAFSALNQLKKLQSSINQKAINRGLQQYQQHRSVSVMHGDPIPVQHSIKQLTEEEKKAAITTRLSNNVAIEKGDDGTCFVERDLSNVGMEGVKAVSAFSCGSSKFDKSFRAHMKKIREKLGK